MHGFVNLFLGNNPNLPPNPKENRKPFSLAMVQNNQLPFAAYHRAAIVAGASSNYMPNVHTMKSGSVPPNFTAAGVQKWDGWKGKI